MLKAKDNPFRADRVLSLRQLSDLVETITRVGWWSLIRFYLAFYHQLRIDGRAHLPTRPPFVLVANHTSHLDAMILGSVLSRRMRDRIFPIAAGDTFFETPVAATFATAAINALPMWRHNCGRHALQELRSRLIDEPCAYILFPEGTRSRDGQIGSFKAGLGMLVAQTHAPVVPCYLDGAFEAMPADARHPRFKRIRMRVGRAMDFSLVPNRRRGWEQIAQQTQQAVEQLAQR